MILSASALVLATASCPVATDITPTSLAIRPHLVEVADAPYDWNLQQGRTASGQELAANTANCNTCCIETNRNGKSDQVHDCGFD